MPTMAAAAATAAAAPVGENEDGDHHDDDNDERRRGGVRCDDPRSVDARSLAHSLTHRSEFQVPLYGMRPAWRLHLMTRAS